MRPEVEFIHPTAGREWAFQVRTADSFEFAWHAHDLFELTVVGAGTGRRYAGDGAAPYRPGDVTLYGPHLPHTYVSDSGRPQQAYVAHFAASLVDRWVGASEFRSVQALLQRAARGVAVLAAGARLRESVRALADSSGPRQTLALVSVLLDLAEEDATILLAASAATRPMAPASADALTAVIGHLDEHFRQPLARDDVAAAAALSPSSVSRLVRRHLGTTLTDYVVSLRVAAACRELAESDAPIAAIAFGCGFTNLANFNRQFRRRRNMTPREYRRAFAADAGT